MDYPMNVVSYAQIALKNLFFKLDQSMRMRSSNVFMAAHAYRLLRPRVSMGTGASNAAVMQWLYQSMIGFFI